MPNGISCAFFAGKNLIYGQKEDNVFKEGIAGAQTARTVDCAAKIGIIKAPLSITGKIANFARKVLYPLIIMSGVYNTAKSDDKIKTGATQAGGIASMYTFEKIAEKGLSLLNKKLLNVNSFKNNKFARAAFYVAKGAAYAATSITGYNLGSKTAGNLVNNIRDKNADTFSREYSDDSLQDNQNIIEDSVPKNTFDEIVL